MNIFHALATEVLNGELLSHLKAHKATAINHEQLGLDILLDESKLTFQLGESDTISVTIISRSIRFTEINGINIVDPGVDQLEEIRSRIRDFVTGKRTTPGVGYYYYYYYY